MTTDKDTQIKAFAFIILKAVREVFEGNFIGIDVKDGKLIAIEENGNDFIIPLEEIKCHFTSDTICNL